MRALAEATKALLGAAVAGIAAATGAAGDGVISLQDWLTIAGATLGALVIVWAIPNKGNAPATE